MKKKMEQAPKAQMQKENERVKQVKNEERIERSKYAYEQVNSWIENADNKVSISCGIFAGVFGVVTFLSEKITTSKVVNECWRTFHHWFFAISLVMMLLSIAFYVLAINPNLGKSGKKCEKKCKSKNEGSKPKKECPIFYGDIVELDLVDYMRMMDQAKDEDYIAELQAETHYNSGICMAKMKKYKIGLWLSFSAIVFALASWVARLFMVQ